jgi:hypothetical protein
MNLVRVLNLDKLVFREFSPKLNQLDLFKSSTSCHYFFVHLQFCLAWIFSSLLDF